MILKPKAICLNTFFSSGKKGMKYKMSRNQNIMHPFQSSVFSKLFYSFSNLRCPPCRGREGSPKSCLFFLKIKNDKCPTLGPRFTSKMLKTGPKHQPNRPMILVSANTLTASCAFTPNRPSPSSLPRFLSHTPTTAHILHRSQGI